MNGIGHEPSLFFVSRDNGHIWREAPLEEVDQQPAVYTFCDGSQVTGRPTESATSLRLRDSRRTGLACCWMASLRVYADPLPVIFVE